MTSLTDGHSGSEITENNSHKSQSALSVNGFSDDELLWVTLKNKRSLKRKKFKSVTNLTNSCVISIILSVNELCQEVRMIRKVWSLLQFSLLQKYAHDVIIIFNPAKNTGYTLLYNCNCITQLLKGQF